jgi:hypothetical protein
LQFDVKTPELKTLLRYWTEKAGDRSMPSRSALDPIIDIPHITPNIWLVDVEGEPPTFRFRLLGNQVIEHYGSNFTGKRLDEMDFGGRGDAIRREYQETVAARRPIYARHLIKIPETGRVLMYERLLLPLSDDGKAVNMVLGGGYPLEDLAE